MPPDGAARQLAATAGNIHLPCCSVHLVAHHALHAPLQVSVWQVDNRMGTFIAVRSLQPPPPGVARTVQCIEERAATRHALQGHAQAPAAAAGQQPGQQQQQQEQQQQQR